MIQIRRERTGADEPNVFEALADRRRRRVLRLLHAAGELHVEDLVGSLAAGSPESPATNADPESIRLELQHRHLPTLADAGLVARSGECVAVADRDVPALDGLLRVEAEDWDDVLACLACPCRRAVLSTLADSDGPLDVTVLALEVAGGDDAEAVDETLLELRHVHLPKLEAVDLVDLDDGGTSVRYLGHPALEDLARDDGGRVRRGVPL